MTTINPGNPLSIGRWRAAFNRSADPSDMRSRLIPGLGPIPGAGGQPQIVLIDLVSATEVEVTVETPLVPGAEWIEWWAGSNTGPDRWGRGTSANPNVSFDMNQVVLSGIPRQESVNDNSFFCYRGANPAGVSLESDCNGFVVPAQSGGGGDLGAPTITDAFVSASVVALHLIPGENATQHDVHREEGDVGAFPITVGNLLDDNIGSSPNNYFDETVDPETTYTYRIVARDQTTTEPSNPFVVTTPASTPAVFPHEPEGLATLNTQPWNIAPCDGGDWNITSTCPTGNLVIRSTSQEGLPTAPQSPPNVARARVNPFQSGTAPFNTQYLIPSGVSELFVACWYYVPEDYINHPAGTKQFWLLPNNHNNSPFTLWHPNQFQLNQQGTTGCLAGTGWTVRTILPNMGPSNFRKIDDMRDEWHLEEWYFKMNTTNDLGGNEDRADGIVRLWITRGGESHQIMNHEDVKYLARDGDGTYRNCRGDESNGRFEQVRWNPTYGGTGSDPGITMFYYADHTYISGI